MPPDREADGQPVDRQLQGIGGNIQPPRGGRRAAANGQVGFDEMLAAKDLVNKVGGVDQAQRALAALAQLQQ